MTHRVEGILLAAGESRRMGYPKPLLKIGERTFVEHITATMLEALCRLVIVLGADAGRIRRAIAEDARVVVVENPHYRRGQLSSLKVGLRAVGESAPAAMVHLGDHPLVCATTFQSLLAEYERVRKPVVIARYHGRRGHPVLFDRSLFEELLSAPEEEGARAVVNADAGRVNYVEVDDPGVVLDLDTLADLEKEGLKPPPGRRD